MSNVKGVGLQRFVERANSYAEQHFQKADADGDGTLDQSEGKRLPKDLQDNFEQSQFKNDEGRSSVNALVREVKLTLRGFAGPSDIDTDGILSEAEAMQGLPENLRDNYSNYLSAVTRTRVEAGGYSISDRTPAATIKAHLDEYGGSQQDYRNAAAKALETVATHPEGLSMFVGEFGGPNGEPIDDPDEVKAEVQKFLAAGRMSLVEHDETGERSQDAWIFRVYTAGQGDHGLWAIVDRNDLETAWVTSS